MLHHPTHTDTATLACLLSFNLLLLLGSFLSQGYSPVFEGNTTQGYGSFLGDSTIVCQSAGTIRALSHRDYLVAMLQTLLSIPFQPRCFSRFLSLSLFSHLARYDPHSSFSYRTEIGKLCECRSSTTDKRPKTRIVPTSGWSKCILPNTHTHTHTLTATLARLLTPPHTPKGQTDSDAEVNAR